MIDRLYEPANTIVAMLERRFVKVEHHDVSDSESADMLWLESTPEDAFSEGKVLVISPATADQTLWFAALDSAHRFGGWPTSWYMTGSADEIIKGVQEMLCANRGVRG
jgi:frataxin-like iron-binding protein CyaY